jgi:hypothetical protein
MTDGGKGDKPRPFSVSQEEYDRRWDAIFQRDIPKDNTDELEEYKKQAKDLWSDSCTTPRKK